MTETPTVLEMKENTAVIAHVEMMQGIINRLADISARCKEWCFAFIGALLVIILSVDLVHNPRYIIIPYVIVALFYMLDSYYLGLERQMRNNYQDFVKSINEINTKHRAKENENQIIDQIIVSIFIPHNKFDKSSFFERLKCQLRSTLEGMTSLSTLLPYGILMVLLIICQIFLENSSCPCSCH